MKIRIEDKLPFVTVEVQQGKSKAIFQKVLLDTGSAGSVFSTELLERAGIKPNLNAMIRRIVGVGGSEFVIETLIDQIAVGSLQTEQFIIEAGNMDYGFDFDGILGFDFLQQTGAIIDFAKMEIYAPTP